MTSQRSSHEDAVVNRFLVEWLADREAGRERSPSEYQARFPGHEATVARELARRGALDRPLGAGAFPEVGQRIGAYRLVAELGRGGQGSVWRAEDLRLGRAVALKVLRRDLGWTEEALGRFRREVAIASRLDHPGICAVYEADTESGLPYVAMQLLEGETLAADVQRHRREGTRPALLDVVRRIEQAARALHAAHEAGVVHRDVKPGNLITTGGERTVVLDFGLAREVTQTEGASLTRTGDVFGTPAYMAPEQIEGRECSAATDVWALGATLFEALTLEQPFRAPTREALYRAILGEEAPDPRSLDRRIPRDLAVIVATALAKEPARRYASAGALADDLCAFALGRPILARPVGPWGRLVRWARREPRRAALSAALAAAVLALAGLSGYLAARRGTLVAGERALAERELQEVVRTVAGGFAPESSLARLRERLELDPRLVPQRATLAMYLARTGRFEEAWQCLDAAPADQAEDRHLRRARTLVLLYSERLEEADELDLELGTPRSDLEALLASIFAELRGGPQAREQAFERALLSVLLVPGMHEAYVERLLFTAFQTDRRDLSELAAEVVVERWPDSATAWFYAATPWSASDVPRSRAALARAVELEPRLALAHASLGYYALAEDHDLERSREHFERALALVPPGSREHLGMLRIRALYCLELGQPQEALRSAERALEEDGQAVELQLLRARALRALGRAEESDEALDHVLQLDPENVEASRLLGL